MTTQSIHCVLGGILLALSSTTIARAQHPPVFRDMDFATARDAAKQAGKLLVLDAMTSWCGPCKIMDRTTWVDADLVAWLDAHAIAVQLDMDVHTDVKTGLNIHAFPTVVVFREGAEFDRVVGLRSAEQMMTWLTNAKAGRTELDRTRQNLETIRQAPEQASTEDHVRIAGELLAYGDYADATAQFVWLWDNRADGRSARFGVGSQMGDLARKHAPAKVAFAKLREPLTRAVEDGAGGAVLRDWLLLNGVVDDEAATVDWARRAAKAGDARLPGLGRGVFELLVSNDAWAAAGATLTDATAEVRTMGAGIGAYDIRPAGEVSAEAKTEAAGKSMPMIPMISRRADRVPDSDAPKPAADGDAANAQPKMIPAIPMIPIAADRVPDSAAPKADTDGDAAKAQPKMIPAIPMIPIAADRVPDSAPSAATADGTPSKGVAADSGDKVMPAIPMRASPATANRQAPSSPEEIAIEIRHRLTREFRRTAARYYGALLAADRAAEAEQVAAELLAVTDDIRARAALVSAALRAGKFEIARERHLAWLEAALD